MDPFATLGIPPAFDVDLRSLERTHRELSRALHPDRYVGSGASERRDALERAIEVNEAWRVVRDPIRRAEALLSLSGTPVGEGHEPAPDPEFLMEMLEQREALADARAARDPNAVRVLAEAAKERSDEALRNLCLGFARGDSSYLASKLGELRFYRRFLDDVSAIEDEL